MSYLFVQFKSLYTFDLRRAFNLLRAFKRLRTFKQLSTLTLMLGVMGIIGCEQVSTPLTDIEQIKQKGTLRVGTLNDPLSYYIGPTGPAGLDYDLAKQFADELGVKLEIKEEYNLSGLFQTLERGDVDIIAAGLSFTAERAEDYRAGPAYYYVSQQVVFKNGKKRPKNLTELIKREGKLVVVQGSHFETKLKELKEEHPDLNWTSSDNENEADLLKQVSDGTIDYTIADSISLSISQRLHPNLALGFEITEDQPITWFINKSGNEELYAYMIEFFGELKKTGELERLEEKYFGHIGNFDFVENRAFIRSLKETLPRYEKLFKKYATEFDWLLLAAVAYQESHWNPTATSPTGVRGIMMLTTATANLMGINNRLDPEQSIKGGANYLKHIMDRVPKSIPEHERIWFVLASYNIGYGHMMDARRLTRSGGGDHNAWSDVKERLPLLENSKYYSKTRYGYARGNEAKKYVENIRRYYQTLLDYGVQKQQHIKVDQGKKVEFQTVPEDETGVSKKGE